MADSDTKKKDNPIRIDVFSLKGGVGKTTVSIRLAAQIAKANPNASVLLIDADLTGTCLGDLLYPNEIWRSKPGLSHLITLPPEQVFDLFYGESPLPVYLYPMESAASDLVYLKPGHNPGTDKPEILYCPSHNNATTAVFETQNFAAVDSRVMQAITAHESAGNWVSTVIDRLIEATGKRLLRPLSAVIIDHSPGLGALQSNILNTTKGKRLLITSPDVVDQQAVLAFLNVVDSSSSRTKIITIMNRLLKESPPSIIPRDKVGLSLSENIDILNNIRQSQISKLITKQDSEMEELWSLMK